MKTIKGLGLGAATALVLATAAGCGGSSSSSASSDASSVAAGASSSAASSAASSVSSEATSAASVATSAATSAASEASTAAAGDASGAGKKLVFLQGVKGDEFYVTMQCGVEAAAKAAGADLTTQGPAKFDATLQNPIIDAITASKPDGLLVAPNDVVASAGPLKKAQEAGIKIALVDTSVTDKSIGVTRISSDNFGGGELAATTLAKLVGGKGEVMVMNVQPGISTTDARQQGFEEGIKQFPDMKYIGVQFSKNDPATAAQLVSSELQSHPNMVGVFATNLFSAQGTATGLKQAGKSSTVKVVGFDAGPAQVDQLKSDQVQALIAQKPYDIGVQGVQQVLKAIAGQPTTPTIQTTLVAITKANMDQPDVSKYLYKASC